MPAVPQTLTFHGQVMHVMFETSTDLQSLMPDGLLVADPHRAFVKAERLKTRASGGRDVSAAFREYQQICITTLAAPPGEEPRHRNLLMWEDRAWGIGGSLGATKRFGEVEMTNVYETDRAFIADGDELPFTIDVGVSRYPLLTFSGILDDREQGVAAPPFNGFFVGGGPQGPLRRLTLDASSLDRPLYGEGSLAFGHAPNEKSTIPGWEGMWSADDLHDVKVLGCMYSDLSFTRAYGKDYTTVEQ